MKFFSTTVVLSFLVAISFMSNVAVAMPVESSSDSAPAHFMKRQGQGAPALVLDIPFGDGFINT
ncbi:hypothetical protein AX14_013946 [Amanita brunnescens Koide BX004]|nr:hypothetical protein AX14_013946 [Amanita brunnescens Koide BX004]